MKQGKRYIIKKKSKKFYFFFYIYMLFVLLSLFVMTSYTWFTLSRTPQVNHMKMHITSNSGLELSADPGAEVWLNYLDIETTGAPIVPEGADQESPWPAYDLYDDPENDPLDKKWALTPITWSEAKDCFYAPVYGYDGRLVEFANLEFVKWHELNDYNNANKLDQNGYYLKSTFYARSGMVTNVRLLAPGDDPMGGAGTYVIGNPNTGQGPETIVRLGFRTTLVGSDGLPEGDAERSPMYIYEPNSDRHVDGSRGYIETWSIDSNEDQPLVSDQENRLIIQQFSRNTQNIGAFTSNPPLFTVKPGQIIRVELYIWLEGQDVDCSNLMRIGDFGGPLSKDEPETEPTETTEEDGKTEDNTQLEVNIQFTGSTEDQSGFTSFE